MTITTYENTPTDLAPITPPDTDSWTDVVGQVAKLAAHVADTDFVPKGLRGSAAAVTAAILYGREVGLPPMTALTQVRVVEGTPTLAAEGMRALILAAGHDFEIVEATGATATVRGRRRGSGRWAPLTWTIDNARSAGLIKARSAWETYPRAMLVARATTELARQLFPDVIHGFRAYEELTDEIGSETEQSAPPPRTGPTVRRAPKAPRKAATSKVAPPPPEGSDRPMAPPPLPGEDGYDGGPATGPDLPPAAPVADPETPDTSAGDETSPSSVEAPEDEVVEAEIVEAPDVPDEIEVVEPADQGEPPARGIDVRAVRLAFDKGLGITDRTTRLDYCSAIVGRPIDTTKALTRREAGTILDTLRYCQTVEDLDRSVTATLEHRAATTPVPDEYDHAGD